MLAPASNRASLGKSFRNQRELMRRCGAWAALAWVPAQSSCSAAKSIASGLGSCLRAGSASLTRPTVRDDTGNFKEQVCRVQSRLTRGIKHRRDLAKVSPNQVFALQAADHHLRIAHRIAANFRHTCTHGIGCIEPVDVESDVGGTLPK